jgi:YVTN family beta-propeller protein
VVVEGTNQVKVIDTTTNTVVGDPTTVGDEPLRIAINNAGTRAYVTMTVAHDPLPSDESGISVIDIDPNSPTYNQVVSTLNVGTFAEEDVAVSPDDSRVYVTSFPEGTVTVIDAASNTVIATKSFVDNTDPTKTETNIGRMEFNPVASRNLAYITDVQDAQVLVVNTDPTSAGYMTVAQLVDIPEAPDLTPQGIAVSADGNRVYVSSDDGTVSVIDSDPTHAATYNTVIDTITVGDPSLGYEAIAGHGNRVYVPIGFVETSTVAVIDTDTDTVIANIPVGNNPGGVAVTPDGTRVYVPNFGRETGNGESNDSDDGVSVIAVLVPATEV